MQILNSIVFGRVRKEKQLEFKSRINEVHFLGSYRNENTAKSHILNDSIENEIDSGNIYKN